MLVSGILEEESFKEFLFFKYWLIYHCHLLCRVTVPVFKMLDQLLSNGCLDPLAEGGSTFFLELVKLCKQEIFKCGDPQKLMVASDV